NPALRFAQESEHARRRIAGVDPFESRLIEVELIQRGLGSQRAVEISYPALHAGMLEERRYPPFESALVRPFTALAEFAAHEQELFAGVRPHIAEQEPQIGELLPGIAGHLANQRSLAVDHLVVRQRQHEVLEERVPDRERQPIVMVPAMDWILAHVIERVVHPAHA